MFLWLTKTFNWLSLNIHSTFCRQLQLYVLNCNVSDRIVATCSFSWNTISKRPFLDFFSVQQAKSFAYWYYFEERSPQKVQIKDFGENHSTFSSMACFLSKSGFISFVSTFVWWIGVDAHTHNTCSSIVRNRNICSSDCCFNSRLSIVDHSFFLCPFLSFL